MDFGVGRSRICVDAFGTYGNTLHGNDVTKIIYLSLSKLDFGGFECQACHLQCCKHFLEGREVILKRVIDTNQIVHEREKTRLKAKVTKSQRHNVLKQPRRIRYSKGHAFKTVLAAWGDEGASVDVLFCHR